ncbi:peptidase inhibitor family I36 protein [Amycolatopsis sp. NPDC005961]|uniref:peptidase inhibitor family I36 protein n=1 Tax=Amycolatopsis sp. NPDC005961 TaxID=3156720 RepID=UPI0033E56549
MVGPVGIAGTHPSNQSATPSAQAKTTVTSVAHTTVAASGIPAPATWDAETGAALAPWDCSLGNVCFWNGFGGTGGRCMWSVADPDWTSGAIRRSWATNAEVKSVYNRGTSSGFTGVRYYRNTGYNNSAGCTRQGQKGDLAGTYQIRSHQWVTGSCG